ncbi:FCD domain-containing protein [Herbiconiux sp. CPCC 205763]|uniref:FCD domain-containing protein n=1 Tax=Herbiconiux aconitum TaxID=2970913 RepID=A0ABT2GUH5_9MICO|nr:FCD domain-containing protein [Herbiconiux aconitum]MCS5719870.1 FCD domain-containing protein [Herbiconiux aconitum]
MKSLKRSGLVELTAEALTEQIAAGTWPVGSALPGEVKLAEQLGVGRSTVREATRALVQAGLLESRQGSGTYVLSTTPRDSWGSALHAAQVIEVYEVREALEVQAAALAAHRRTDDDLVRIRAAFEAREALVADQVARAVAFVDADLVFHRAVVEAAHNPLLLRIFDSFVPKLTETLVAVVREQSLVGHDLDATHAELLDAIVAADPAAAIAAVTSNVHETIQILRD